jgi:hypothetical protein
VSRDIQPSINLEVTVPHIVLPSLAGDGKIGEEMEQIRLLPVKADISRRSLSAPEVVGEASTYATYTGLFHLFRLKVVPEQGRRYLLQILRQRKERSQSRKVQGESRVTNELALTLEYHQATEDNSAHAGLIPGENHVVIMLNEDGVPDNYTIDGAEC